MAAEQEIERKFLVRSPPDLGQRECERIEQGYLAVAGEDREVRVRRKGGTCSLGVKGGTGEVRDELEVELSEEQFERLWRGTEGARISKRRYLIPAGGHEIELDSFEADLEGLLVAEVEFDSEPEADRFDAPDWLGEEITGDERYLNRNLARHGMP